MSENAAFPEARAVTRGPRCHFFGYYDKFPWDATGRYMLGLETSFQDRPPGPEDTATIGLIDTAEGDAWRPIARTAAWCWQQGTMLQWLPTAPDRKVIHNAREGGRFVSVVRDVFTGESRVLPREVYALSPDGTSAVCANFARTADTRPGYGYAGVVDPGRDDPHPENDGVYHMDLETGEDRLIFSLAQAASLRPKDSMAGAKHWFNHLQFNTAGTRFLFLHRWSAGASGGIRETRLLTSNRDGSDVRIVADDGMVSHFDWRDETHILAWARVRDIGKRFFLFTDGSDESEVVGEGVLTADGHCSYSPDRRWILNDTYPDGERMRALFLYRVADGRRVDLGRFFAPRELDGEIRCDLHPRWSRDGREICFDSVHEGTRQMYRVDVSGVAVRDRQP